MLRPKSSADYVIGPRAAGGGGGGTVDRTEYITRVLPTVVDDYVEFGNFDLAGQGPQGKIAFDAWITAGDSSTFWRAKKYCVTIGDLVDVDEWLHVAPLADEPGSIANDFALEINKDQSNPVRTVVRLRARRTLGTDTAELSVLIVYDGVTPFAATTLTGSDTTPLNTLPSATITQRDGYADIESNLPVLRLRNRVPSDADGGRRTALEFFGRRADNSEELLGQIEVEHEGTGADNRGILKCELSDGEIRLQALDLPDRNTVLIGNGGVPTDGKLRVAGTAHAGKLVTLLEGSKKLEIGGGNIVSNDLLKINYGQNISIAAGSGRFGMGVPDNEITAHLDIQASLGGRGNLRLRPGVKPTPVNLFDGLLWTEADSGLNYYNGTRTHRLSPKNIIYVHDLTDFPDKDIDGYIPLEQREYVIHDLVVLDGNAGYYGFKIPPGISPTIRGLATLGYTNQNPATDALFKGADVEAAFIILLELNLYCDGTGRLFDLATTDPNGFVLLQTVAAGGFNSLGTISDLSYYANVVNYIQGVATGLTLTDNNAIGMAYHRFNDWFNAGATFVTINGTQQNIQISSSFFQPKSNEKVLYLDPALTTSGGSVVGNAIDLTQGGEFYQSGSQTQSNIYWTFAGNTNLADSTVSAQGEFAPPSPTSTVIPAQDALVVLAGDSNWVWNSEERLSGAADGVLLYTGRETLDISFNGIAEVAPATAGKTLRLQFARLIQGEYLVTFTAPSTVNETDTARQNGDLISFYDTGGTLPTGLRTDVLYYVINQATNSFQLSYTVGGPAVTFTGAGTPPNTYRVAGLYGAAVGGSISIRTSLSPIALILIQTGDKILLTVHNETDSVDVDCYYAYVKAIK